MGWNVKVWDGIYWNRMEYKGIGRNIKVRDGIYLNGMEYKCMGWNVKRMYGMEHNCIKVWDGI